MQEALSLQKEIKSEQITSATYDILTDRRVAEYQSNEKAIDQAVARINQTRATILGMHSFRLQEIIDRMREHESWHYEMTEVEEIAEAMQRFEKVSEKAARPWR